jgi:hypothetical protein
MQQLFFNALTLDLEQLSLYNSDNINNSFSNSNIIDPEHTCFNSDNEMIIMDKNNRIHVYDCGFNHKYSFNFCYSYIHIVNITCDNYDRLHCTAYSNIIYVVSIQPTGSKLLNTIVIEELDGVCSTIVSNRSFIVFKCKYRSMLVIYNMNKENYNVVELNTLFEQICCSDDEIYLLEKIWYITNIHIYNFCGKQKHIIVLYNTNTYYNKSFIYNKVYYSPSKDNLFVGYCLKTGHELMESKQLPFDDNNYPYNMYYDNYGHVYCNHYLGIGVYRDQQQQIVATYCLVVLLCDDYFVITKNGSHELHDNTYCNNNCNDNCNNNCNNKHKNIYSFLSIITRLPIELQVSTIHMIWKSNKQFISSQHFDRYVAYWLLS